MLKSQTIHEFLNRGSFGTDLALFPSENQHKEYNLVCDQANMPAFFILLFNTGLAIGPIIAGKVSDRFGRVRVISGGAVAVVVLNLILTFNTFGGAWGYAIIRMLAICVALILALPAMVYPTEVLTPKYRSICGLVVVSTALGAGILLVILFAVFIRDWRTLQLIVSFISLPSIGTFDQIHYIKYFISYGPYSKAISY